MTIPDSIIPTKICTKCGQEFPATTEYFRKGEHYKYGVRAICWECERAWGRAWVASHREEQREYARSHRAEARNRYNRWAASHREQINERGKRYASTPQGKAVGTAISHRRLARKKGLPVQFTTADVRYAHEYWGGICPCCGKQIRDLFGEINPHMDHWIPLLDTVHCPGTVPWNMLPLCNKCNLSKGHKDPNIWLVEKFGKRKAAQILQQIDEYFESIKHRFA